MQQLSVRLESVFELVRESRASLGRGRVIDIGSDHGFLSVRCLEEGVSDHAVCTDIHEAPAQKSRSSLIMAGFKDKCTVKVTDGMDGIELQPIIHYRCQAKAKKYGTCHTANPQIDYTTY